MWSFLSRDPTRSFPFEIGEKVDGLEDKSIWTLHHGKRKANGEPVSVFIVDLKSHSESIAQLAKSAHKRLKTLRHPNVLLYVDGLETDNVIYVVTEEVTPLATFLKTNAPKESTISWGLYQVVKGLSFLHNDCKLKHNNVNLSCVFVNRAGEWKLGAVDYITPSEGEGSTIPDKGLKSLEKYNPPEMTDMRAKKRPCPWAADMWGLGCLIWEVFNGTLPRTSSLKALGKIPKPLVPNYCELVGANPVSRPNPAKFIDSCRNSGGFMKNSFVDTNLFLEEIQIKDQTEKTNFLSGLSAAIDDFPEEFCRHRILPLLLQAFEFGNAGSAILTPLLKLGKLLDADEYQKRIVPIVVKLFSSTDRNTRVKLLQQMDQFIEHLQPAVVNDQIFPHICHGFNDTVPVIRENTVKAMLLLACKLNDKNLNIEVLKHFARLQAKDEQGGIRTNTTICLGKLAGHLNPATRQKVLSSAFVRAMKDPFPPARTAGVLSMLATQSYYSLKDCALRVLPTLCTLTVDPDQGVRQNAFKAIKIFLDKLEKVSENPELLEEMEADVNKAGVSSQNPSSWTGWAMTSLTSRLYRGAGSKPSTPGTGGPQQAKSDTRATKPDEGERPSPMTRVDGSRGRDSDSDYGNEGGNDDGWNDNNWGNMEDEEEEDTTTAQDTRNTNEWDSQGWGDDDADDDNNWDSLETPATRTSKSSLASSSTAKSKSSALKLGGTKKTQDMDFGDWGLDEPMVDMKPIKTSSKLSKSRSGSGKSTPKGSPKKEMRNDADLGGWDDGDDAGGWGSMDAVADDDGDGDGGGGWGDDDDWGAMEDLSVSPTKPAQKLKPTSNPPPGWGDSLDFEEDKSHTPASTYNWGQDSNAHEDFFGATTKPETTTNKKSLQTSKKPSSSPSKQKTSSDASGWGNQDSGWDDDGWGSCGNEGGGGSDSGLSKAELAKKKREERRLQREKELQEKRAAKKASGPTRLGVKKD
ncbi:N-terminal kinase-like protein [Lytechinus pictus]|uniref:N-terminal kinase-like protein n=1 Tax=Lytechinus pictus TaxID=7653 RepID=UPI0030B9D095